MNCQTPVQLKEWGPAQRNQRAALEYILSSDARKLTGNDLILAIYLNRQTYLTNVSVPPIKVCEIWFWGWSKPDHSELFLCGGRLREDTKHVVPYKWAGVHRPPA